MRAGFFQTAGPLDITRLIKARTQLNNSSDLFSGIGRIDQRFDNGRITTCAVQGDFNRQHLWVPRCGLDPFDNLIEAIVRMMKEYVLVSQDLEKIDMRWKGRIARRLKWPVSQLRKGIVCHERHEMRHRKWAIEFVSVSLRQVEEPQQQFQNIFWAIRFYFEPNSLASTRTPQLLLDGAQQVFSFLLIDVQVAIARDSKRVNLIQDQAGKQFSDVLFDKRGEVNVLP